MAVTGEDVLELLDRLDAAGATVWCDGGWGVDALVGYQSRSHGDLDLAIRRRHLTLAERALQGANFHHDVLADPGLPARLVMRDARGRQVDFHPLVFDSAGNGWQQLSPSGRAWGCYEVDGLRATGTVGGRSVRCVSAELQMRFRRGYEWGRDDECGARLLARHFGLPLPPPFRDG
jgi:lincosamide nucleotidyltransferase A/C/D/E